MAMKQGVIIKEKEGKQIQQDHVIWCFNPRWMDQHFKSLFGREKAKDHDKKRDHTTFYPKYMNCDEQLKSFVHQENPLLLNQRLTIQQGLFLCPGNAGQPFLGNLQAMKGWEDEENVYKLRLELTDSERPVFVGMLRRMNLSEAALFPGLDGFARSLGEHLLHFNELLNDPDFDEQLKDLTRP
jgi:hypothetical protein